MRKILTILFVLLTISVVLVSCTDGKLTGNSFATLSGYKVSRTCTDSDGGNNPDKQGTVEYKGLSSAKIISLTDSCKDAQTLLEHYCDGGVVHLTETFSCRNGCEHGACVSARSPKKSTY